MKQTTGNNQGLACQEQSTPYNPMDTSEVPLIKPDGWCCPAEYRRRNEPNADTHSVRLGETSFIKIQIILSMYKGIDPITPRFMSRWRFDSAEDAPHTPPGTFPPPPPPLQDVQILHRPLPSDETCGAPQLIARDAKLRSLGVRQRLQPAGRHGGEGILRMAPCGVLMTLADALSYSITVDSVLQW
jgi:hypothetical protein